MQGTRYKRAKPGLGESMIRRGSGTQRKDRQAEDHARTILETIQDGFMGFDRQWRIVFLNAAAEGMLGRSRSEVLQKNFWEVAPGSLGTIFEGELRRAMS